MTIQGVADTRGRRLSACGWALALGLLLIVAAPGRAQLLDHSLAVDNQLLVLRNFPGPGTGELAEDSLIDGLSLSGGLIWGLGEAIELHLDADLGVIYDDDSGDVATRATVHRAYLEGKAGGRIDGRVRGGIIPHRIANGLLLDSDEPTVDLHLRGDAGATGEASLLLQGLLVAGESPFVRAMASLDGVGWGHLSLWAGGYTDRSNRLASQATAARNVALLRRLRGNPALRRRLSTPRGLAVLDGLLADRVASEGQLWLAGLDGSWSGTVAGTAVEGGAVAVYEHGDYHFHGAFANGDFDTTIDGWLVNVEARASLGERLVAGPFLLYMSGDDRLVDDRLTTFIPIAPFSPYATLFFNGSLNRDFLAGAFQPLELSSFGVVAGGVVAQVTAALGLDLNVAATYLRADGVPAAVADSAELGWEVDSRLAWHPRGPWSAALEWDWLTPGDLIKAVVTDANTMQLFAATVRYAF